MSAATQQKRRSERRREARRAILDATETLLLEDGRVSIRRVADRSGYTAPTIYHYFGDKKGLLDTLLEARFEKLSRQLKRVPRGEPEAYLRALAQAFVRFGLRYPDHYRLLSVPRAQDQKPPRSAEEARETLERAWIELWEAGRLRASEWRSAAQGLWALAHGIITGHIGRPDHDWSKTLVDDSIDALLRGLIAPPPAEGPGQDVC